jgi:hemoglobin
MADPDPTLYQKLGGEAGVAKLISVFYLRVLEDAELSPFFKNVSIEALKRMQQDFFAMALGETADYKGRSLAEAHHGRGIHAKHVGLFVQHLLATLRDSGVSEEHVEQVISRIDVHTNEVTGTSY